MAAAAAAACNPPVDPAEPPLNVVVVLADDMRHDATFAMPILEGLDAVRFTRAYVPNPMCCPSRASLLAGGFDSHETGVLTNDEPNGGAAVFVDRRSLSTRLQEAGYATGYVGKYLNHYVDLAPYVPPGWTTFHAMTSGETYHGWTAVEGTSGERPGTGTLLEGDEYLTDHHRDEALAFLDAHADEPFFLLVSSYAPHSPWEPAPEDEGAFEGLEWRAGAFAEADVSDKPPMVRQRALWSDEAIADNDRDVQRQLETLRSLDRALGAIVDRLEALGVADRTVVVFTSDNGSMWGEHRLVGKGWLYEESVRVPLIVRWPGVAPGEDDRIVAANLDLAATIAGIAGSPVAADGASLAPVLAGEDPPWREALLLENYTRDRPVAVGAVSREHKVVLHAGGLWEAYDLVADPYEEDASGTVPEAAEPLRRLIEAERGLLLRTERVDVRAGSRVDERLETWGGTQPLAFRPVSGRFPEGLALGDDGRITGQTSQRGRFVVEVEVTDASESRFHGGPQRYLGYVLVDVDPTRAAPEVDVASEARSARVRVELDRPARVLVEVSSDPTFDEARRIGPIAAEGPLVVPVDGLVADRPYHARVTVDGVPLGVTAFRTAP